jgi:hypothetical protein
MASHRGRGMKDLTAEQIVVAIDRSLRQTAEDVRLNRIPLDGRTRLPPDYGKPHEKWPVVPNAAE